VRQNQECVLNWIGGRKLIILEEERGGRQVEVGASEPRVDAESLGEVRGGLSIARLGRERGAPVALRVRANRIDPDRGSKARVGVLVPA
jgi:hypothetical protein